MRHHGCCFAARLISQRRERRPDPPLWSLNVTLVEVENCTEAGLGRQRGLIGGFCSARPVGQLTVATRTKPYKTFPRFLGRKDDIPTLLGLMPRDGCMNAPSSHPQMSTMDASPDHDHGKLSQHSPPADDDHDHCQWSAGEGEGSSADEASRSQNGSSKRKRPLSVSCETCKQRKVKCDRGQPSCGWCLKNHSSCTYLPRKKPGLRAGYGRELEARLGE